MSENEDHRIIRLEDKVDSLSDDLRKHVIEETGTFRDMQVSIERMAVTSELQGETMKRMAATLDSMVMQNGRIGVLEHQSMKHDDQIGILEGVAESNKDEVSTLQTERKTLLKVGSLLATVVAAAWAVVTFIVGK